MNVMRRVLGVLVMLAGILGLVLSLAGLVLVWAAKPTVAAYATTTIDTLSESVVTSQRVMEITGEALGATIDSVDALSAMLSTTAATVQDTKPFLDKVDTIMSTTLPSTLEAATDSLHAAQEAARVLESTIQSLDSFRSLLSAVPLVGAVVEQPGDPYNPERPMADSLGDFASSLEGLPDTFVEMSTSLSETDEKLVAIQANLITMSDSVGLISSSLSEYEEMIVQSKSSMDALSSILTNIRLNLPAILNGVAIVLSLFLAWLLAAQVVILSQGWELYQGTADRMESEGE
jgi:methyl-accepting chemotaxis protein